MNSQAAQTPFFYNLSGKDLNANLQNPHNLENLQNLKNLLIVCQKLGIPIVTKSLAFYFFHRSNALKLNPEPQNKAAQILACISLAMKINEHVKKFKEVSLILLEITNQKDLELPILKDEMMVWELLLQEDIYFIQEWDSPFRFLLKIVLDLGGILSFLISRRGKIS